MPLPCLVKFWNEIAPSILNAATDDVDKPTMYDCQQVAEYIPGICHYMFSTEEIDLPSASYMSR